MSERRTPPSVFTKRTSSVLLTFLLVSLCLSFVASIPYAHGAIPNIGNPVKVSTTQGRLAGLQGQGDSQPNSGCYLTGSGIWVVFYWISGGGIFKFVWSSDGATWNAEQTAFTSAQGASVSMFRGIACSGQNVAVLYDTGTGAGKLFVTFLTVSNAGVPAVTNLDVSVTGSILGTDEPTGTYDAAGNYWIVNDGNSGSFALEYFKNEAYITPPGPTARGGCSAWTGPGLLFTASGTYWAQAGGQATSPTCYSFANGAATTIQGSRVEGRGAFSTQSGVQFVTMPASSSVPTCYVEEFNTNIGTVTEISAGMPTTGCATNANMWAASDGLLNAWAVYDGSTATHASAGFAVSSDGGATFTAATISTVAGAGTNLAVYSLTGLATVNGNLQGLLLLTATAGANGDIYVMLLGSSSSSTATGTFTIGSCPTKNTATTTLANNTVYMWTGSNLPGNNIISAVTTEVASSTAPAANENLYLAVYVTTFTGSVSPANPLQLTAFKTFVIAPSTKNTQLSWAANVPIAGSAGGVSQFTYAIALLGNSKIVINNSALSGMVTGTTSGGLLPSFITGTTPTGTQLFFCAALTFQFVVTSTVTSTSTSTVTTGGTATTTVSSTTVVTSLNANAALGNSVGIAFVLLILLAPAFAIAVPIGIYTKSPIGVGIGFTAGLAIGALLGNQGGLIPFSVLAGMMVVVVLLIVGFLLALKSGQG